MTGQTERRVRNSPEYKAYHKAWAAANRVQLEARRKAYRLENPERARAEAAAYLEKNRDKIRAANKAYRAKNKEKIKELRKIHYEKNKERISAASKVYRVANHEQVSAAQRLWAVANPDRRLATQTRWQNANPAKLTAQTSLRRARLRQATPRWADLDKILEVYAEAARVQAATGVRQSVDHIVPLRGKGLCGLHVYYNLQVLPLSYNCRKSNKSLDTHVGCGVELAA